MSFFHYSQNNSGGSFDFNEEAGITHHVVIEAESAEEADQIGQGFGIYFYGCEDGMDCECCGDRWSGAYGNGDAVPMVYGEPAQSANNYHRWMKAGKEICVHYKDGRKEWF